MRYIITVQTKDDLLMVNQAVRQINNIDTNATITILNLGKEEIPECDEKVEITGTSQLSTIKELFTALYKYEDDVMCVLQPSVLLTVIPPTTPTVIFQENRLEIDMSMFTIDHETVEKLLLNIDTVHYPQNAPLDVLLTRILLQCGVRLVSGGIQYADKSIQPVRPDAIAYNAMSVEIMKRLQYAKLHAQINLARIMKQVMEYGKKQLNPQYK